MWGHIWGYIIKKQKFQDCFRIENGRIVLYKIRCGSLHPNACENNNIWQVLEMRLRLKEFMILNRVLFGVKFII